MSSKSRGLTRYAIKKFGPDSPGAKRSWALGDVNTTLIRTENGATITLYLDTVSPRPYDLILRVQGTQGIYSGTLDKFYFEGRSPKVDAWEDAEPYYREFEHPLWRDLSETASRHGHGEPITSKFTNSSKPSATARKPPSMSMTPPPGVASTR